MVRVKRWLLASGAAVLVAAVSVAITLTVTGVPAGAESGARTVVTGGADAIYPDQWQYTKADYEFAAAALTDGYEDMTLAQFNNRLLDWKDEDAFHQGAQRLERLLASYPGDKPNADLIETTIRASYHEQTNHHYSGSCDRALPAYWQDAVRVEYADVFGDAVPVQTADATYVIEYRIADETALTVGQRDGIFQAYQTAMEACMAEKTEVELKNHKTMRKALEKELARLDQAHSTAVIQLTSQLNDYYLDDYRQQ